jgi:putative flavoprotein involved in K+ transport
VSAEPGLYFVGLLFQYALTSSLVGGVGRDAEHIAKHIVSNGVRHDPGSLPGT